LARGDPYGSFSGAFTGTISFDWAPEPLVVANELRGMAEALDNMMAPLQASRAIAVADMNERFETKTSPEGEPWAPWSASYAARNPPGSLLERTGAMRGAATSPDAFEVTVYDGGGEVMFSGAGLPEYWIYHQMGAIRQSLTGEARKFIEEFSGEAIDNVLPARPFVGISEKAQIAIIDVFDEWFGGIVGFYMHPGGGVQRRLPSGRFGPMVGL
jgi:phage gpG-like protein